MLNKSDKLLPRTIDCRVAFKQKNKGMQFVYGREAQALLWLYYHGKAGITSKEVSSWALRLSAYIHRLRIEHGLDILMQREYGYVGKDRINYGRYTLLSDITIKQVVINGRVYE